MKKTVCLIVCIFAALFLCGCEQMSAIFGGGQGSDTAEAERTSSVISGVESIPLPAGSTAVVSNTPASPSGTDLPSETTSSKPYELIKPQAEEAEATVTVNADGGLNMRYGPGTSYGQIALIPNGTKITRTAQQNGWSFVTFEGNQGWVSSEFVK